ncbi:Cell wall-active antibiotics response 4TMS YvqF [Actinacidiphila yanglinensis]|uniref:Cell wall-active antibiotics response 4TMS YvqF n=1 Tax=Actinacidiphila yanglinensis TaxID=310779 RepID=A0A1H6CC73_9ACTN|nr:DUF1707 domain-containing protein [Actinacidiphila yanglinensis]SEG70443.1 Cell wall-active antibiotics response 4TMS YvqF [Actinacidiphila yanglinensis]
MSEPSPRKSPEPGGTVDAHLRVSDDERDHSAALLGDALAAGRIDVGEHAERLEAVYAARTRGDLAPVTADLPTATPGAPLSAPGDSAPVEALFAKVRRAGQWPVPPHTVARARFGAIVIDLRQAVFTRREVVIEAVSFFGKVEILVPDNANVYDTGSALFGKRSQTGSREGKEADGPVVRITGRSVFGHVRVMRGSKWAAWLGHHMGGQLDAGMEQFSRHLDRRMEHLGRHMDRRMGRGTGGDDGGDGGRDS